MAIDYSEPTERVKYIEFYGRNVDQMPKLIADKRVPLSVAGLMERRLNAQNPNWMQHYHHTGDAIADHPDGEIKIILDSPTLRGINPKSKLSNGALVLTDKDYATLNGESVYTFDMTKLQGQLGRDLTLEEVRAHPIWKTVARDQTILNAYAERIFEKTNANTNMGIYPASSQKTPTLRALYVDWLDDRSRLDGLYGLGDVVGRLVGVAPEVPNPPIVKPTLEEALVINSR